MILKFAHFHERFLGISNMIFYWNFSSEEKELIKIVYFGLASMLNFEYEKKI